MSSPRQSFAAILATLCVLMGCEESVSVTSSTQNTEPSTVVQTEAPENALINGYYVKSISTADGTGFTTSWEPIRLDVENQQFFSGFESNSNTLESGDRFSPAPDYLQIRKYNDDGNMVSWETVNQGQQTRYQTYVYNDLGQLSSSVVSENSADLTMLYSYNELGQLGQVDYVVPPTGETISVVISYDDAGRRSTAKTYQSSSGDQPSTATYIHNMNNQLVERRIDLLSDGTIDKRHAYEYDETGNRTGIKSYELGELVETSSFRYSPTQEKVFNLDLFKQTYTEF